MHRHFALVLAVGLSALAFGNEPAGNEEYVVRLDCEQDADGNVWGKVSKPNSTSCLLGRWDKGKWTIVDTGGWPDETAPDTLADLQRLESGDVLGYWERAREQKGILTIHRGEYSRVLTQLEHSGQRPQFLLDGGDNLWMSSLRNYEYRDVSMAPLDPVSTQFPDGAITRFYVERYADEGRRVRRLPDRKDIDLRMEMDAKGRVWVSARYDLLNANRHTPGFYVFDSRGTVTHPSIVGIPDVKYTCFEPKDKSTFWAAAMEEGLYEIDSNELKGTSVPSPENGALAYIYGIHTLGADTYIFASDEYDIDSTMNLWRLRKNSWEKLLTGLDPRSQCLTQNSKGLWVGTRREGLWLIPATGEPVKVDWRLDLPLAGVFRLYTLPGGEVLMLGTDGQTDDCWVAHQVDGSIPAGAKKYAPNLTLVKFPGYPVQDEERKIWAVLETAPDKLSRWNGENWDEYPLPSSVSGRSFLNIIVDSRGLVWVMRPGENPNWRDDVYSHGSTAVFSPESKEWAEYPRLLDALVAERAKSEEFRFGPRDLEQLAFGPQGQIAVQLAWQNNFWYYDNTEWKQISPANIPRPSAGCVFERPFFDSEGIVCAAVAKSNSPNSPRFTLKYKEGRWTRLDDLEPPPVETYMERLRKRPDWPGAPQNTENLPVAVDEYDALWYWTVQDGRLYRNGLGVSAPQFLPAEADPFKACVPGGAAYIGLGGIVLLPMSSGWDAAWAFIKPRQPILDTSIEVSHETVDTVKVTFAAIPKADCLFTWRLDGGVWTTPKKDDAIRMVDLLGGEHTVEAYALDAFLTRDPTLATATFTVDIAVEEQIAGWIADLSQSDFDTRKAAIRSLTRAGDKALSALRAARSASSDDVKWWIDVAIQEVSKAQQSKDSP